VTFERPIHVQTALTVEVTTRKMQREVDQGNKLKAGRSIANMEQIRGGRREATQGHKLSLNFCICLLLLLMKYVSCTFSKKSWDRNNFYVHMIRTL
jgi:hypothetical protein